MGVFPVLSEEVLLDNSDLFLRGVPTLIQAPFDSTLSSTSLLESMLSFGDFLIELLIFEVLVIELSQFEVLLIDSLHVEGNLIEVLHVEDLLHFEGI